VPKGLQRLLLLLLLLLRHPLPTPLLPQGQQQTASLIPLHDHAPHQGTESGHEENLVKLHALHPKMRLQEIVEHEGL